MDPEANPGIKYCIISILYINDSPCKYASKATKAHNIIDINADNCYNFVSLHPVTNSSY